MARAANVSQIFTQYTRDMETSQCSWEREPHTSGTHSFFHIVWVFDEAKEKMKQ